MSVGGLTLRVERSGAARQRSGPGAAAALLVVGLIIAAAGAVAAESPRQDLEKVITLPRFVVREKLGLEYLVDDRIKLRPIEDKWRYGQQPLLEVLSDCPDDVTHDALAWLERLHVALARQFPPLRETRWRPTCLILCVSSGTFNRFRPRHSGAGEGLSMRFYHFDDDEAAMVIDMGWLGHGRDAAPRIRLLRTFAHFLLSHLEPRQPPWFEEGFARSLSYTEFYDDCDVFGRYPAELRDAFRVRDGIRIEERGFPTPIREPIPLARMFSTPFDSPDYLDAANSAFARQSFAFVQLCLYGEGGRFRQPFRAFLARLVQEPFSPALFRQCFGLDCDAMEELIRSYTTEPVEYTIPRALVQAVNRSALGEPFFRRNFGEDAPDVQKAFASVGVGAAAPAVLPSRSLLLPHPRATLEVLEFATPIAVPLVELRKATPAEVGRIKGDAFRLARRYDDARAELVSGVVRGNTDARLFASFGYLERVDGIPATAEYFFTRAVHEQVDWSAPYAYLARARLQRGERVEALRIVEAGLQQSPASAPRAGLPRLREQILSAGSDGAAPPSKPASTTP